MKLKKILTYLGIYILNNQIELIYLST